MGTTTNFSWNTKAVGQKNWAVADKATFDEIDDLLKDALNADGSIIDDLVKPDCIQDLAVTAGKIVSGSVTTAKLNAVSIEEDKIADGAVTGAKFSVPMVRHAIYPIWCDSVDGSGNPVVGSTTYTDWFLCDGGTYRTVVTPSLADRMSIGVGTIAGSQGATGGGSTKDFRHSHSNQNTGVGIHNHDITDISLDNESDLWLSKGGKATSNRKTMTISYHTHTIDISHSPLETGQGLHSHTQGSTGQNLSTTQDIMNPYIGLKFFMYIPE